jgi:uncharacterized integral membrane protein
MSRKLISTLILLAVAVVVMLLNTGDTVSLHLLWTTVKMRAAFAYLGFTTVGVLIGILLK